MKLRLFLVALLLFPEWISGFTSLVRNLLRPSIAERVSDSVYGNYTLSFTRSIDVATPSYVQILKDNLLSVTSFSLLRKGCIFEYDINQLSTTVVSRELRGDYLWPNELSRFEDSQGNSILLIPDGFLLPGQNDGGLYIIVNPSLGSSRPIRITKEKPGWFYHKATHMTLPNGQKGILTARALKPVLGQGQGELVWLSLPSDLSASDNSEYEETVLAAGPDVMFEVADLDKNDDTIEVIAAHFFGEKITVHSLQGIDEAPYVKMTKTVDLKTEGKPYGLCLANLSPTGTSLMVNNNNNEEETGHTHLLVSTHECSYDIPSAINMAFSALKGEYPSIKIGNNPNSHDGKPINKERRKMWDQIESISTLDRDSADVLPEMDDRTSTEGGGSLFAYRIPTGSPEEREESISILNTTTNDRFWHKSQSWERNALFRGFKVRGWGGIFSPGAPGFPYVFRMPGRENSPPLILLAGDCTASAYIFTPRINDDDDDDEKEEEGEKKKKKVLEKVSSSVEAPPSLLQPLSSDTATLERPSTTPSTAKVTPVNRKDKMRESRGYWLPEYDLAYEVECGATVGSAATHVLSDGSGDVQIFVPSYELNKLHVFRLNHHQY